MQIRKRISGNAGVVWMLTGRVVEPNPYLAKGERETELAFFFPFFGCQQSYL